MENLNSTRLAQPIFSASRAAVPPWKRGIDLCFCLLMMPVLAFGVLLMTIVTSLVSPGPVFYRQDRIGFQGRRFQIYKFRTMKVNANTVAHQEHFRKLMGSRAPMMKLDAQGDPRLIPGGWLLRASGLDELPQLINVLHGEMSLVGPRPCLPNEFAEYLPAQRERVEAVPGLTGLWQVSGKNRTTFEEMIRWDVHYARNVSPLLDLQIIILTPWALLIQMLDTYRMRQSSLRSAPAVAAPAIGNLTSRPAMPRSHSMAFHAGDEIGVRRQAEGSQAVVP